MTAVAGKRIFILGDSLSATASSPGAVFADELRARGAAVAVNGKVSRSAYNFFRSENGARILTQAAAADPDLVYVILGTNDLGLNLAVDTDYMARIRDAFPRAEVWGVGPPRFDNARDAARAPAVIAMMRKVFRHFIDLQPLTPEFGRTRDGVHFTAAGGRALGQRLAAHVTRPGVGPVLVVALAAFGLYLVFR